MAVIAGQIIDYAMTVIFDLIIFYFLVVIIRILANATAFIIQCAIHGTAEGYEDQKMIPGPGVNIITLLVVINSTAKHTAGQNIFNIIIGG
jgi:hypothetical protein